MKRRHGIVAVLALSMVLGAALTLRFEYPGTKHIVSTAEIPGMGTVQMEQAYRPPGYIGHIIGSVLGSGIGLFLFAGIVPALMWAAFRFRREQVGWVTIVWCVITLVLSGMNYKTRAYQECRQYASSDECIR